jgi:hypothetical protein
MAEHPPPPGPLVTPNFLAVEEALGNVTFPIAKRDLLDILLEDDATPTALLGGRNVELADIVAEIGQDYFESEDDFRAALESRFAGLPSDPDPEPLPSGPQSGWQADVGPGASGGATEYVEPPDDL